MISRARAARDDDEGAMLIVALIVITSVALVTGALLTQGGTNYRATRILQGVAGTSYNADAAAKVAVNNLRLGAKAPGWQAPTFPGPWSDWVFTDNADGTGCFGAEGTAPKNDLELKNLYPKAGDQSADGSARVECSTVSGTGVFGAGTGVGINDPDPTDSFAQALTTVGTTGTLQGMILKPLGTGNQAAMPVRGGIASKSYIDVTSGALVTDGWVKAEGGCTGQIVSTPAAVCNAPGTVSVPPAPAAPITVVPGYRNPSSFASPNCTFQPGFYNNAKALSDAVNSCATARFASGRYYFDFRDEERGTGTNEWSIATRVIGGELATGVIPGACKSPILNDAVMGVQFVFGGTSRITVSDTAHIELCGPSNGGDPPTTLYQQPTGSTETATPLASASAGVVTQLAGNGGGNKWTTGTVAPTTPATSVKDAIAAADTSNIAWTVSGNNDDVGLDLSNFAGLSTIPAGADISSAVLRVKYAKTSAKPLQVTVTTQTPANVAVTAPDATGWGQADLAGQLRTLLASGALDATRPVLQLRLMDANRDDKLTIDAVTLAVTYVRPSLRAAQDVKLVYAPGGNFHGEFVVQGATYAPKGYIDLDPGSFDTALVAFRWGLVASGVNLKAQPSQQFGYPLVSMPVAGKGLGSRATVMDLKIFVCPEQAGCATGGTHALTVRVMITDPPYSSFSGVYRPEPGRRKVEILSWSEQK